MRKVIILGAAGTLGSTTAFCLAQQQLTEEIVLADVNENVLKNHLMDLKCAFPKQSFQLANLNEHIGDADLVILAASVPNRNNVKSRNDFLTENLDVVKNLSPWLQRCAKNSLIITATNPVDIINYYLYTELCFDRRQLIGYTLNDSARFERSIRNILSIPADASGFAPVMGEHGETQVPVFSQVQFEGERVVFSQEQKWEIVTDINQYFSQFNALNVNRTTGWTSGIGIAQLVSKLSQSESSLVMGSSILQGEYGIEHQSIAVPLLVSRRGVERVVEWKLDDEEQKAFFESSQTVAHYVSVAGLN
ncbi:malate dehydrogenase [Alicyclobacillus dauci]|uniref:L-lactate dehydrogenase n=1 Tax=Alicyclobacillus dauci TaxID=1475485 RepID=A0ABY6Z128_9BACL|nr:hypothetical protein [Alicyclobacillus dauci]WAH35675.1 hypothetical protein NZD86_15520 [Alicyclobacillus dauci]